LIIFAEHSFLRNLETVFPPIFGFQAARTEPQQLLSDERPILQVWNLFGIAGDIPSHEDTPI
jgi:hypothetical protein